MHWARGWGAVWALLVAGAWAAGTDHLLTAPRETRVVHSYAELEEWVQAHTHSAPPEVPRRAMRRAHAAALANYRHDGLWSVDVHVGTPPKSLHVILDTGSADLWLSTKAFAPQDSQSFQASGRPFSITYNVGRASGYTGTDRVSINGAASRAQGMGIVNHTDHVNFPDPIAGVLGMGLPSLSTLQSPPFWDAAHLDPPAFGIFLRRNQRAGYNEKGVYGGVLTLGGHNTSMYQGEINYMLVTDSKHWQVPLDGLLVGDDPIKLPKDTQAYFDSGTALIGGPPSLVENVYAKIPGAEPMETNPGHYTYPCTFQPNLSFAFGKRQYLVSDADFQVVRIASEDDEQNVSEARCLGALYALSDDHTQHQDRWLMGAAFMKNVYTILDGTKPARVGLAELTESNNNGTATAPAVSTSGATRTMPTWLLGVVAGAWIMGYYWGSTARCPASRSIPNTITCIMTA